MIKKIKLKLFFIILIQVGTVTGFSQNANTLLDSILNLNEPQKQILILNSWGSGLPIPDKTKQGIHVALEAGGVSMNDIFFEDLDLVRSSSKEHRLNLVSLLRGKLEHKQIGIVILIGSSAIEFLANEAKELFPDAALIALITPDVNSLNNDPRRIMYLPWRVDPEGSVKLALELFPKTKHVFVITGAKDGILPFLDEAKKAFLPWVNKLDFEYTNEMTYEEMILKSSSLSNESIILYSTFFTDRLNRSFIPAEVVTEVCKKSKVPVFATLEYYMGLGIVGGALLETERLGKQTGGIALDYLSGKIVLTEHVTSFNTPIHSMLDWQKLKHFEFNIESIPDDCIIVGKPPTLWEQNKLVIIIVIGIFLILSVLIITLLFWNRRIHKMRMAALESERQLKLIADNFVNGMIYQVAMLDEDRRKFNYISENVNKLYGCTVEEAKENANLIYGKLHPEDINGLVEKEKEALKNMSVFETEARVITPNGNIRWAYYISQPRIINGIVCWDGIEVDITERKQMELDLINAKEKAEESDRLKSAFLATMSHELRTPLNAIIGFSDLTDEDMPIKNAVYYSKIVNASGTHLLSIVEDLFDITLIEAGQIKTEKQTIDLLSVLDELKIILENEQKRTEKSHLELSLKIPANIERISLSTDESKFKQLLINLLKNALKFTHEGHVHFGFELETKKSKLKFYVEDTGIGIPKDKQELIFDVFRQVEETYTKTYGGTGIGLSLSRKIAEILGGEIWVESELGKGSTFYFTIPYEGNDENKNSKDMNLHASEVQKKSYEDKLVLIVEDDDSSYDYLNVVLKMQGIITLRAENGEKAIKCCKDNPSINLVLMDINMPVMNGLVATKEIKKFKPKLTIIAQTAYAISGDKEKALEAGCDDYISKPINKIELQSLIQKYF